MSQKNSAILILLTLGLLQGIATQYPEPFHVPEWISWSLAIACGLTIYWWYRTDSIARGLGRPVWLSIFVGALPIVGLPYYLFRSRGFRSGLCATGGALGVFAGVILSSMAAAICVAWLRWQSE